MRLSAIISEEKISLKPRATVELSEAPKIKWGGGSEKIITGEKSAMGKVGGANKLVNFICKLLSSGGSMQWPGLGRFAGLLAAQAWRLHLLQGWSGDTLRRGSVLRSVSSARELKEKNKENERRTSLV